MAFSHAGNRSFSLDGPAEGRALPTNISNCLLYLRAPRLSGPRPSNLRIHWLLPRVEALEHRHTRAGFHYPGLQPHSHPESVARQDHRPEFLGDVVSALRRTNAFPVPHAANTAGPRYLARHQPPTQ